MEYVAAARALCEFTAKRGDLDLRFTPSPSAQEGMAGHAIVASRRGANYRKEITLAGEFQGLRIRGRADGYDPDLNQLEEYKTHRGDVNRIPENHRALHWAQVRVYGWMLCQQMKLSEINLALVYFDITSQRETVVTETQTAAALEAHFNEHCARFLDWAQQELAYRTARNESLTSLRFPHAEFHSGQRELAEAAYKATSLGRCLMVEAPTGIGKTLGTIFPLLKAVPTRALDKVFFLVAKTSGRRLALDALRQIAKTNETRPLRVLEMVAREKSCEFPGNACHGAGCLLAKGFYDRLPTARQAAIDQGFNDRQSLRQVALAHNVCPYYLSQELVRWADVVIADYNYYFDFSGLLHSLTAMNQWKVAVLVDEAHNLVERARGMYSATLDQAAFATARRLAPPSLKRPLERVNRAWAEVHRVQTEPYEIHTAIPLKLITALQQTITTMTDHLAEDPSAIDPPLQQFLFDAMQFCRVAESFDASSLFDVTLPEDSASNPESSVLCIRNVVPAKFLEPRFRAAHASVLFSATLSPGTFYQNMLGLPENTRTLQVGSPFTSDQLSVHLVESVSTRYRDRQNSLATLVDVIAGQYERQPGNYLAFFSSFDYLNQVAESLWLRYPGIPLWKQERMMPEAHRETFLERFTTSSRGIGFAVLGGAFAEGIDLPGDRLIGAFIATLGLPQINPVNEAMKERMGSRFGSGFDYTYLYPGLQKVVQAAGRVIRTQTDRGVLYLMDDRFARPAVQKLLPRWWTLPGAHR